MLLQRSQCWSGDAVCEVERHQIDMRGDRVRERTVGGRERMTSPRRRKDAWHGDGTLTRLRSPVGCWMRLAGPLGPGDAHLRPFPSQLPAPPGHGGHEALGPPRPCHVPSALQELESRYYCTWLTFKLICRPCS